MEKIPKNAVKRAFLGKTNKDGFIYTNDLIICVLHFASVKFLIHVLISYECCGHSEIGE